jgi:hypothetical protein
MATPNLNAGPPNPLAVYLILSGQWLKEFVKKLRAFRSLKSYLIGVNSDSAVSSARLNGKNLGEFDAICEMSKCFRT